MVYAIAPFLPFALVLLSAFWVVSTSTDWTAKARNLKPTEED